MKENIIIMGADYELFPGKNLSGLFEDIYKNQQNKKIQISQVIADVRKLVKGPRDLLTVGPTVSALINSSISNDDSLIKMANIVQKMILAEAKGEGDSGFLSESEKKDLLSSFNEDIDEFVEKNDIEVDELVDKVNILKSKNNV